MANFEDIHHALEDPYIIPDTIPFGLVVGQDEAGVARMTLPETFFIDSKIPNPTGRPGYCPIYNKEKLLEFQFQEIAINTTTGTPALSEDQTLHVKDIAGIINDIWYAYQDSSDTGCGKTFTNLEIARLMYVPVLIVCPAGPVMDKWRKLACIFGVEVVDIISYDSLSGRTNTQPKHRLLVRKDETVLVKGKMKTLTTFAASSVYDKLVRDGILLVFDESQKAKNQASNRTKSCQVMARHLVALTANKMATKSRIACLSASPGNKESHAGTLTRLLGLISKELMFFWNIGTREFEHHGFAELVTFCETWSPDLTAEILTRRPNVKKCQVEETVSELYDEVIKVRLSRKMTLNFQGDYANGFYILDQDGTANLTNAVGKLQRATGYTVSDDGKASVNLTQGGLQQLQEILGEIEFIKLPKMAQLANDTLTEDPNAQVVLYVNRLASIDYLKTALAHWNPIVMMGSVPMKDRVRNINRFQEDNSSCRLLISTITTGSVGLDFDDKFGTRKRYMYLIPRYMFIDQYQGTGRVCRRSTKSIPVIRFIYGQTMDNGQESSILDAMAKNTDNAKKLLAGATAVPFPGDYPTYYEQPTTATL